MGQLYLCDQCACEHCRPPCRHTEDIEHAVNFKKDPKGNYWEVIGKDPIFFGEEKESCQSTTEPAQTAEPT